MIALEPTHFSFPTCPTREEWMTQTWFSSAAGGADAMETVHRLRPRGNALEEHACFCQSTTRRGKLGVEANCCCALDLVPEFEPPALGHTN